MVEHKKLLQLRSKVVIGTQLMKEETKREIISQLNTAVGQP